jgi:isoleucyl-tRNA synthetase
LNVRDIVFSFDETTSGVRYKAVADWPVLGKKLRKDLGRVKNGLPQVSSDAIKSYIDTGKLIVDGIELQAGDLTVQRYIELPSANVAQFATNTDNDVVVRLDIRIHEDLQGEWHARELTAKVQKLRKKAGLQATDDVDIFYQFEQGAGLEMASAFQQHGEAIRKAVGTIPQNISARRGGEVLAEEEQEIADIKFTLYLVSP